MASNNKTTLVSLDFDGLKTSLKGFLQNQSQFADFDFEGAGLNILLDILAYNTHYNAFYLNMVANEMFLDTAVLRQTVVSHAKSLGYTGVSTTSAQATVNVSIQRSNTDNTTILTLPRFTQLTSAALDGSSYNFVTLDDYTTSVSGNTFFFPNILISEGAPTIKVFVQNNTTNPLQYFDIVDANVDTSSIQVIIQKSSTNIFQTKFNQATDSTTVTATSNVYFLQEGTSGNYQIYFGDGIIGTQLIDGNIVIVSYVVSSGDAANYLSSFQLQSNPLSGSTSTVTTVAASGGGSPPESISSIKFNAPKSYIAQNRAVTENDYIGLINKNYPYFDAVNVWGGETENPPVYGKVFISAKPKNGYGITVQQQQYLIKNIIRPIGMLTVTPEFVSPDYNYIKLVLDVDYDSKQTTKTTGQIVTNIVSAVNNYANLNLNTFNAQFGKSRMLRAVDDSDPSIISSDSTIYIEKRITPAINVSRTYTMNTDVQLQIGTIDNRLYSSPSFTINDAGGTPRQSYLEETPESYSGIDSINILTSGSGYTSAPSIIINGDGSGANAYAQIVNGKVRHIIVDKPGADYTTATVTASGGGGFGCTLKTVIQGQYGILRTYYYDQNNNKTILNNNAGSIDYLNGIITLNNFAPTAVAGPYGVLSIFVQPATSRFGSNNEIIITIDPTDQTAVTVNLTDINNK